MVWLVCRLGRGVVVKTRSNLGTSGCGWGIGACVENWYCIAVSSLLEETWGSGETDIVEGGER